MTINYGFDALNRIPKEMKPWGLTLEHPVFPGKLGQYVVVDISQATIEQHHQVEVINEDGDPLPGINVIFGFGSGPDLSYLKPDETNWFGNQPSVLRGNAQVTDASGYAQHTFGSGGEWVFVWDLDDTGLLKYPSPILKDANWRRVGDGARFEHTGIKVVFQRRDLSVVPKEDRLNESLARIDDLEHRLNENVNLLSRIDGLERKITNLENRYSELLQRVQLEAQRRSSYDELSRGKK